MLYSVRARVYCDGAHTVTVQCPLNMDARGEQFEHFNAIVHYIWRYAHCSELAQSINKQCFRSCAIIFGLSVERLPVSMDSENRWREIGGRGGSGGPVSSSGAISSSLSMAVSIWSFDGRRAAIRFVAESPFDTFPSGLWILRRMCWHVWLPILLRIRETDCEGTGNGPYGTFEHLRMVLDLIMMRLNLMMMMMVLVTCASIATR